MPTALPRLSVTLEPGMRAAAEAHAKARKMSLSALVAEALEAHLKRDPTLAPAAAPGVALPVGNVQLRDLIASNESLTAAIREVLPSVIEAALGYRELQLQVDDVTVALGRRMGTPGRSPAPR